MWGHERVHASLRRQELRPVYRRPYRVTTDSDHRKPVAPNVLDRRFQGWRINQACVMYLASRRIVGGSMSERMKSDRVCQSLTSAY